MKTLLLLVGILGACGGEEPPEKPMHVWECVDGTVVICSTRDSAFRPVATGYCTESDDVCVCDPAPAGGWCPDFYVTTHYAPPAFR